MSDNRVSVPTGFRPIEIGGPFVRANGPLYGRWTGTHLQLGFRVEERHTNPIGTCHGGMMATFCDMLMPMLSMYQGSDGRRSFLPTINLQVDYLGPAPIGSWVQGQGEVLRRTRTMVFVQGLVEADGEPALRTSGIFRYRAAVPDGAANEIDFDPLGLK
jgi:uncharacterized protein (TIGR00369 family)